jgi:hypothetical protein
MTAQHVPQKPLWRRVFSLPRTRLGWWAIGLAAPSLVVLPLPIILEWVGVVGVFGGEEVYGSLSIIVFLVGLVGGIVAMIALADHHERSWLVWLALVPWLILFQIFVWAVLGFNYEPVVTVPVTALLLISAGTAFWFGKRIGFFRDSGKSR